MATAEAAREGGASVLPATAPMEEDAWDSSSSDDCVAEPVEFEELEAVAGVQTGVCTPVGLVSEWPGLGAVAAALGGPNFTSIHLLSGTHFHAKYEWGAVSCTELIRSMQIYYGSSWYNYVLYRRLGCTERLCGHVRLIVATVKGPRGGTRQVVERLVPAGGVPGSVFEEAGHERLRLAFDDDTAEWPSLEVVPLSGILRIFQVVPDVEALAPAFCMGRGPPETSWGPEDRRAARFLNNKLFKSTTPSQQCAQRMRNKIAAASAGARRARGVDGAIQ